MSIRVETNLGTLKVLLFWEKCPEASENFLVQCAQDTFNDTKAKRNAKGFLVQFPNKTASITKEPKDEITPDIKHQRGSLGMLKTGSNGFYFAYDHQQELDGTKTIFGKVVSGFETLDKMEAAKSKNDKPIEPVIILSTEILANPFADPSVSQKS